MVMCRLSAWDQGMNNDVKGWARTMRWGHFGGGQWWCYERKAGGAPTMSYPFCVCTSLVGTRPLLVVFCFSIKAHLIHH